MKVNMIMNMNMGLVLDGLVKRYYGNQAVAIAAKWFGILAICAVQLLALSPVAAQSFSEWFKQKKTQKKYLKAQIAALGGYLLLVEKGYGIAKDGLTGISVIREDDFLQHSLHLSRLERVSPRLQHYAKLQAIPEMIAQSEKQRRHIIMMATAERKASHGALSDPAESVWVLSSGEQKAIRQFCHKSAAEADKDLKTLELLVSNHKLKLTADERMAHIDQLYNEVKRKRSVMLHLGRDLQALIGSRVEEAASLRSLKLIYQPLSEPGPPP